MKQFDKEFKKIIMNSWVNGDSKKCCKRIKELIGKVIDKILPCSTFNRKGQCNEKDCINCGFNKQFKKEVGLK